MEEVKRGERSEEWEVRKDGGKIVRAEVRTGADVVSLMFWGLRKKITKQEREKRGWLGGRGNKDVTS